MGGVTSGMSKNAEHRCWRGTTREEDRRKLRTNNSEVAARTDCGPKKFLATTVS